jgi:F0F1-type ATP synthase membrane subunit c/vacuolar-type H+-ATPase subunit K
VINLKAAKENLMKRRAFLKAAAGSAAVAAASALPKPALAQGYAMSQALEGSTNTTERRDVDMNRRN